MGSLDEERVLLEDGLFQGKKTSPYTGDGSVDINGNPVHKSNTGNWRASPFILGTECCEPLAYYGIATNLVSYLTNKMHEGNFCGKKCYDLARHLLSYSFDWSRVGRCLLGKILDDRHLLHNLLHRKYTGELICHGHALFFQTFHALALSK